MDNLVNTVNPLVIDIILAVIILLVGCIKAKAGAYQSIMSMVVIVLGIVLGFVCSNWLKGPVSDFAWKEFGPSVEKTFDNKVESVMSGGEDVGEILQETWNDLIDAFESDKLSFLEIKSDEFDYHDSEMVQKMKVISLAKSRLLCDKICQAALFGLTTALAILCLTIIKNIVGELAEFSIIGWANHLLGFLFGAVEIIVILLVIIRGAGMLGIGFFQQNAQDTVLLKWLVGGDIDNAVYTIRNLTVDDIKNINIEDLTTVDFESVGEQVEELLENIDLTEATDAIKDVVDMP